MASAFTCQAKVLAFPRTKSPQPIENTLDDQCGLNPGNSIISKPPGHRRMSMSLMASSCALGLPSPPETSQCLLPLFFLRFFLLLCLLLPHPFLFFCTLMTSRTLLEGMTAKPSLMQVKLQIADCRVPPRRLGLPFSPASSQSRSSRLAGEIAKWGSDPSATTWIGEGGGFSPAHFPTRIARHQRVASMALVTH